MESGRTLFLFMRLCNKAELCINKFVNSLLITNENSVLLSSESGHGSSFQLKDNRRSRVKRSASTVSIELPPDMEHGQSILINELTEENMTRRYDSVASTVFRPYIVDPWMTINRTERLLYRRIHFFNLSLTISSVGQQPLPGPLKLTYPTFNSSDDEGDATAMVIHWNPDEQQWQISGRTCIWHNDTTENNILDGTSTVLICNTRLPSDSLARNETYLTKETQFAIATVASKIINNPPRFIGPTIIKIDEDSEAVQFLLLAQDMENDLLVFRVMSENNALLFGNITLNEAGILTISLCSNCYGTTMFEFSVEDKPGWEDILPAQANYSLAIDVLPVNDPPSINVLTSNGTNILPNDPTESIIIFREQHGQTIDEIAAIVIAYDIDGPQTLHIVHNSNDSNTFDLVDMEQHAMIKLLSCKHDKCDEPEVLGNPSSAEWKGVYVNYTQDNVSFVGLNTIKLVAQDETGTYSDVITLTVAVMDNKCQHGTCSSLNPQQYTCNDTRRAVDFDLYYTCKCPTSWTGAYCERDVDECALGLCEAWKVCQNTIGSYNCYCKASDIICKLSLEVWEFSVIVTAVVVVIGAVVAALIMQKIKSRKNKKRLDKEITSSSISLTALMSTIRNLGPARKRFSKVAPLGMEDSNVDIETSVPPISTFTWTACADIHTKDIDSEEDFVHPAPRFDRSKLVAELKQRKMELEALNEVPEDDLDNHPPPELNQPHLTTIYKKYDTATTQNISSGNRVSEFNLFSATGPLGNMSVDDSQESKNLGPARKRFSKVAPLGLEDCNVDIETSVPPISTFTGTARADIHTKDIYSEEDFVHPAPRFDRSKLVAELKQRRMDIENEDGILLNDNPNEIVDDAEPAENCIVIQVQSQDACDYQTPCYRKEASTESLE